MSTFKCKMCGGTLEIQSGSTVAECEYCGARQTLPRLDDERRANLYDRANHFRRNNEFDKATAIYEQILNEDNTDAEAYWSLVLCRYGIEYVEDPLSHRRVPTVHRAQFTSIFDDDNYQSALRNSDAYQRVIYEEEAKAINEIQKGILSISQKEEPFDVFICYKETDDSGKRTPDSVLANDLYHQLTQEGFKVFFARITLEDKLGTAYEPYIFAALNSAKVMVALGTKPEYFNAVWVKNEWSRFLSLIKNGEKKMLIPAYKDMDPYDLPQEFSHLQAQDMSKLGFMQDLIRGIKKILGRDKKPAAPTVERVVVQGDSHAQDAAPLLRRAFLFLEDGEFDNADEYAEKVLDINPECAEAYVVKLLIELGLKKLSGLEEYKVPISGSHNYQKAIRFASPEYRETIEGYNNAIINRIETAQKSETYARGLELMNLHRYDAAVQFFQKIPTYKDSAQKVDDCKKFAETERRDGIYQRATQLLNAGRFDEAARIFEIIEDHKDSKEKIKLCAERKETARKDAIYFVAMQRVLPKNANDVAIKKSIEELHTISGYRDVDDQIRTLNARLEKWYDDKKKAEEAARIKAEEDRRTREREAELRRIKAEKAKKTAKKAAKIGIPSVVALATLLILIFTLIIPLVRYNKADKLFNAGKYDEAMVIYNDLGSFSESNRRIETLKGIEMIDDEDYEEGIAKILSAGVPVKLTYGMGGGNFSDTTYLIAKQKESNNSVIFLGAHEVNASSVTTTSVNGSATIELTYNSSADFTGLPTPDRKGYRFVRWELDSYSYRVKGVFEIKLNAVWSEMEFTIKYSLNGGKVSKTNPTKYKTEDGSFTLNNPTKAGYTFIGWTGSDLDSPTINVTVEKGSAGDRNYEANWKANTYTINLNPNGGFIAKRTLTVTFDQAYTLKDPEWDGHTFMGWYNGYDKVTSGIWTKMSDIQLTARWSVTNYNITYNLYMGTNSASNPSKYTIDDEVILTAPTRKGYTFAGWTYAGQTTPILNVTIPVGSIGDKEYTANWTANSYIITFNADGGTVSPAFKTVIYDENFTLPTPVKSGYTFAGWFNGIYEYTNGIWKDESNITVKAKWSANSYNVTYADTAKRTNMIVTFNYNYSGSTSSTVALTDGQILTYPKVPLRNGFAFAGWYTNSSCTTQYNFNETITSDITLYAKWVPMSSSCYSREYVDIAKYTSSSSKKSITISASSSSSRDYYYFTCYKSGTYTINAAYTSGDFFIAAYNVTQCVTVISEKNLFSTNTKVSATFTANAGDVIYISLYKFSSSGSTAYGTFYVSGADYPTSTAIVNMPASELEYNNNSTYTFKVYYGVNYNLPTLSRIGYSFLGWYNGNNKLESGVWNVASDVTLTPRWQANTYTVTLDANGGTVSPTSKNATFDANVTLPMPIRTGYTFGGWFVGTKQYTTGTWETASDVTLVAKWTANDDITYVVKHYKQDVSGTDYQLVDSQNMVGTADWEVTPNVYSYEGFTSPEAQTVAIAPDGTTVINYYYIRNSYTVTLVTNGGDAIDPITQKYQSVLQMPAATRESYTFGGWFTDINLSTAFTATTIPANNNTVYAWWVEENKPSDFSYSGTSEITVSGYKGASTTMWIPAYIGGVPVATISSTAFVNKTTLVNVVVPDTVTSIGSAAFRGCSALKSLSIPFVGDKKKTTADQYQYPLGYIFGTSSYTGGKGITQYYIGENVNSYTSNTYYIPETLKNIIVTNDNIISLGSFHGCSSVESITIPTSVTYIGDYAFMECRALKTLNSDFDGVFNIPVSVTYIGRSTFNLCASLSKVTTGDAIETIGYRAFYGCTALVQFNGESVGEFIIPDTVASIGSGAFYGSKMASLTLPFVGASENCTSTGCMTFGYIFGYYDDTTYDSLTSTHSYTSQYTSETSSYKYMYYIPKSLETVVITKQTSIPYAAFMNCDLLTTITIPNNVESIGGYAFYNCKSLSNLNGTEIGTFNIPQSVTKIEEHAFQNCLEATNITLSNSVTAIDEYAFAGCAAIVQFNSSTLSELKVPTSCISIGTNAFNGLAIIANVIIPDSVETIGSAAFRGCSSIKSMTLPFVGKSENCTSTGCMTFGYIFGYYDDTTYDNLTSTHSYTSQYTSETSSYKYMYYIPKSIGTVVITKQTSLPYAAFMNCDLITSITLPDNTNSIGGYAFYNCKKLSSLNSNEEGKINSLSYVTAVEKYTFYYCRAISDISLSDKVTAINDYAFYGCSAIVKFNSAALGEMIIPASCEKIGESAFYGLSAITKLKIFDMVSSIGAAAFGKMTTLHEMTVPFIGNKNKTSADTYQYPLGYFFGTSSYSGGTSTKQYYYGSSTTSTTYSTYYIPTTLTKVVVTIGDLNYGAFYGCSKITSITANENAVVNAKALYSCSATLDYASYSNPNYAWNGRTVAEGYHSGNGSLNDPYIIANGDELAFFAQQVNAGVTYEGVYFKLSYDISLGNYEFGTIGTDSSYFKGIFDGNGHTISGLTINSNQQYVGLFSQTSGTIKKLGVYGTVTHTTATNLAAAGMLIGQLLNSGTISDCYTVGTLTSNGTYTIHCGGLVGCSKGMITDSYSSADVKATSSSLISYAGGLVGYLEGTVTNSVAFGDVYAKGSTDSYSRNGGFVGSSSASATITNCYRSNAQALTKNGVANTAYNELGTEGTMSEILNFCKTNWDGSVWSYNKALPSF